MPIPIDPRNKPAAVKIHVTTGAGVDIAWADGHASHYDFPYLRELCPCATCNDEREKKLAFGSAGPASAAALPMFMAENPLDLPMIGKFTSTDVRLQDWASDAKFAACA